MKKISFLSLQSGQGLVETLITLLIISVGVIAIIRFQNYLSYGNNLARQQADATILALQKMESLRDYHVLRNTTGYTSYESITSGSSSSSGITTTYNLTWTVTTNNVPAYKTIDVSVTWTDLRNTSKTVRLVSRVAGIDPSNSAAVM